MHGLKAYRRIAMTCLILFFVFPLPLWSDDVHQDIRIQPETVNISSFFSGVQMHVACDLPPNSQAVLSIRGRRIEEELMRKSHQWELWRWCKIFCVN